MKRNRLKWMFAMLLNISIVGYITASSIIANKKRILVHEGRNAVLTWIINTNDSANQAVECTAKVQNEVLVKGRYNEVTGLYLLEIPQNAQLKFNHRLKHNVYSQSNSKNVLLFTIADSEQRDSGSYICKVGDKRAQIDLQVYRELVESEPISRRLDVTNGKQNKYLTTVLCALPEPRVTMNFKGVVTRINGAPTVNPNCYLYTIKNFSLFVDQKHCGEKIQLEYKGLTKTIKRSVSLFLPLLPRAPTNVKIHVSESSPCPRIRWDGPNIGSCTTTSLSYDVTVFRDEAVIKTMQTSSNVVEVCGIDFLKNNIVVRVRNRIGNLNSTWTEASVILDDKDYDGMQTTIIACAVLALFLLILLTAYCLYVNKYKLRKIFSPKENVLLGNRSTTEEDGDKRSLNESNNDGVQQHLLEPTKTDGKRKVSRKASTNDVLLSELGGGPPTTNGLRKTSLHLGDPKQQYPNHATRFYSLQRNIEREKKKLEEQEIVQQQEEFYAKRRNTDSKILHDLRATFSNHQLASPNSNNEEGATPYSSILCDNSQYPGSPVYDVLPQTRSSASTNSTGGGRSFHEEDELHLIKRRRNTNDSAFCSETDPSPLYDVLPRKNTDSGDRLLQPRTNSIPAPVPLPLQLESSSQAYDELPSMNNKNSVASLDRPYKRPAESIYDVPVRPRNYSQASETTNDNTEAKFEPFSSHRTHAIQT